MKNILFFLLLCSSSISFSNEIDYGACASLHDAIAKESQEIQSIDPCDHEEIAQLHVSRAESWLLLSEFEKALEDFQNADIHLGYVTDSNVKSIVEFRIALGEVVSFDNLGLTSLAGKALDRLQDVVDDTGCVNCQKQHPCQGLALRSKFQYDLCNSEYKLQFAFADYDDIYGPDIPPRSGYCEEVVIGVASSMQVIASLAPSPIVRASLIGIIEALKHKCLKCCKAGEFWKACVAPIARKWKEWKGNKENHLPWDDWV